MARGGWTRIIDRLWMLRYTIHRRRIIKNDSPALFVCHLDLLEDPLFGKPFDLICGQMQPRDCYPYMEPSYLIWTCCDWIAPVVESRLGLMKTWYTLVTVDKTLPFLSSDCPVTKTRKLRLRVVARL